MSNKGFGEKTSGHLWWDATSQRKTTPKGYKATRDALETKRYFLTGTSAPDFGEVGAREALQRKFCRYWQSRWVNAYISDPDVGVFVKAAIRRRQGSTFEKRNTALIRQRLDERLTCLPVGEEFRIDLNFARPLAFQLAADLLGIVLDPGLCHDAAEIGAVQVAQEMRPEDKLPAYRALQSLYTAVSESVDNHGIGRDGLMRDFREIASEHGLDREFALMSAVIFLAGSVTLGTALPICLARVANSDELTAIVSSDVTCLPEITEEVLRLHPVALNMRLMVRHEATGEPELLGFNVADANRDPVAFSEPDKLIINRKGPRSLSYGSGAHMCDGVKLARLTLKAAIPEILQRMRGLEIEEHNPMEFTARFGDLAPSAE